MPGKWTVAELEPGQYDDWDRFVNRSPQGSVFSTTSYLNACGARFSFLACFRNREIAGGIVLTRSRWGKHTNPQLCKYLGLLLAPFEGGRYQVGTSERKVQSALIEAIGKPRKFEYMFHPGYSDWLPFHWAGFHQSTKYTYRIHFKDGTPASDNYNSRLRGKINKAENDPSVELIDEVSPAIMFDLLERTFENQGRKFPLKASWLAHYMETLIAADMLQCTGVRNAEGKITCVLGVAKDHRAHYLVLNGVDYDIVDSGQNEWLIDRAINRAAEQGAEMFDFEGSMIKSVESFYRQFGGRLDPYFVIST